MELIALKILIGFLVGILIGMTGLSGGVLLLPLLILLWLRRILCAILLATGARIKWV